MNLYFMKQNQTLSKEVKKTLQNVKIQCSPCNREDPGCIPSAGHPDRGVTPSKWWNSILNETRLDSLQNKSFPVLLLINKFSIRCICI